MVDFKKRLKSAGGKQPLAPSEIYDRLDRASDKGPLRPAQEAVLAEWHDNRRSARDAIVKLHTGQGKTLIGLLILQSKLNEGVGPVVYLCPDNFLVEQTALQAKQFGFEYCTAFGSADLPEKFLDSKAILICTVQKLFNGRTKFGLHPRSIAVGAVVIDDAHACIEAIRDASTIRLERDSGAYPEVLQLFSSALESQGQGTFADLDNGAYDALLPVPYWDWIDHSNEIAKILVKHGSAKAITYAWPLIKDILPECECLISGQTIEIYPRLAPLEAFGSYAGAKHRVFMSATISDDSFLIKGLGLSRTTVEAPLTYAREKWSGEKMVLIPSLLSEELSRDFIVEKFAQPVNGRKYGVVTLVPSFKAAEDWKTQGATVADKASIEKEVQRLRKGECDATLAVVNRYDGIDLPDKACRVLILDSRPFGESLHERHLERCLTSTDAVAVRIARTIEQGMGRSVRGEKDYSAVLLIGPELVRAIRSAESRAFLSAQTRQQVEIGLNVAEFAKEDLEKGINPGQALDGLIAQSLRRDEGWKEYYTEEMEKIGSATSVPKRLLEFAQELKAEQLARDGRYEEAAEVMQLLSDKHAPTEIEKGWYLQEAARHLYRSSKVEAEKKQTAAHKRNRFLLRPRSRAGAPPQLPVEQRRVEKIIEWIQGHPDPATLTVSVESLVSSIRFGIDADVFEAAFDRLGKALGVACERPDKEWKEGPDNLWRLRTNRCVIVECKTEVVVDRKEIAKYEAEQMNQSFGWFKKTYPGVEAECILIIPPRTLAAAASLAQPTAAMQKGGLDRLVKNVRGFFGEFFSQDLQSLSAKQVQQALDRHHLGADDLFSKYTSPIKGAGLPGE
ncbi:DEAD/DEAH box helicase family protein [Corallococcus exercitus]|uniref:DEAD/DEAH box helicase family protein n=1 Tax=Corallococcus exercitus TaxID=2316736 RepID=A0A7Y4JN44_9BACT|nr:DEAD/DEAH box helicase family protein [Corallococcus exercitus]NOK08071.1 DEAD/DEAH box helicase family protein [Corallococcus exercitus]